jgi:FkbM family methyltransferase
MNKTKLSDGTSVYCLRKAEAKMLDHHVEGYLQHGISIKDGDVVFDVGANIGVFSVRAAQMGSKVKVYSFEPIPDIVEVLAKNANEFGEGRITTLPYGVSNENSTATFTYFPNTPALSTLHPEQWDDNPGAFKEAVRGTMVNPPEGMKWMKLIPSAFSGLIASYLVKGKKQVTCQLKTLSSIIEENNIQKIDLLKIDCEGAEWDVLEGIKEEHWAMIKSIVIEVHDIAGRFEKVNHLLKEKGFMKLHSESEKGLENTALYNIFALRQ